MKTLTPGQKVLVDHTIRSILHKYRITNRPIPLTAKEKREYKDSKPIIPDKNDVWNLTIFMYSHWLLKFHDPNKEDRKKFTTKISLSFQERYRIFTDLYGDPV